MANQMMPEIEDEKLLRYIREFDTSLEALRESRDRAMRDRDFYDGNQWTDEQIKDLEDRGQAAVVTNHIAPKVNYILGEQITSRVDPAAWPQTPAHEENADALTQGMRSVTDRNDSDVTESEAFEEFLIEGCAAVLVVPKETDKGVDILIKPVPWDRFAWDYRSRRRDFGDAEWLATVAWYEESNAKAQYPGKKELIEAAIAFGTNVSDDDLFEDWPSYWAESDTRRIRICQRFCKENGIWYESHFTKVNDGWLIPPRPVQLVDDMGQTQCPLIAASAYVARRRANKPPERYGVARGMISPQQEINKRRSKALHYVMMAQTIAEEGAFLMTKEEVKAELQDPSGYLVVAPGVLAAKKIEIRSNLELAQSQFQLLQEAKAEIDNIGPQAPLIGSDDRVQTGRSLDKRREAGEKQLKPVFDSLRYWQRRMYRAVAWYIKKYWPGEQWVRVTDDTQRRGYQFVAINRPVRRGIRLRELLRENVPLPQAMLSLGFDSPIIAEEMLQQATAIANQQMQETIAVLQQKSGQAPPPEALQPIMQQAVLQALLQMPEMNEFFTQNPIGDIPIDIKVDVTPESPVLQHEQFMKLAELAGTGQVPITPEMLVRASNLREKKEILAQLNPPPDPMQEQLAAIQLAQAQAEVDKTRAEAADKRASAEERLGNVRFKDGPQAAKTTGQAAEAAAKAGSLTLPDEGPGGES